MPLKLGQNLGFRLLPPQPVAQRRFHHRLLQHRAIVQGHRQRVRYRPHVGVVVGLCEFGILDAGDAPSQGFDEWGGCGVAAVGVVGGFEPVVDEHRRHHVLHAVVAVGEVVHRFVLLVDDADAGFVGAADDGFNVGGGFASCFQLGVDFLGGFDGGLGVEFRLEGMGRISMGFDQSERRAVWEAWPYVVDRQRTNRDRRP